MRGSTSPTHPADKDDITGSDWPHPGDAAVGKHVEPEVGEGSLAGGEEVGLGGVLVARSQLAPSNYRLPLHGQGHGDFGHHLHSLTLSEARLAARSSSCSVAALPCPARRGASGGDVVRLGVGDALDLID